MSKSRIYEMLEALEREKSPCEHYNCSMRKRCATELLACDAFLYFVQSGRAVSPFTILSGKVRDRGEMGSEIRPDHEKFLRMRLDDRATEPA